MTETILILTLSVLLLGNSLVVVILRRQLAAERKWREEMEEHLMIGHEEFKTED